MSKRLKQATRRNLEAKGYVHAESEADLLVNFFANIEARQEIHSTASAPVGCGYYTYQGYSSGHYDGWASIHSSTENYREGTLTIDLVDRDKKVVAWQGQVEGEIDPLQSKTPGQRVDHAVAGTIAKLPAHPGQWAAPPVNDGAWCKCCGTKVRCSRSCASLVWCCAASVNDFRARALRGRCGHRRRNWSIHLQGVSAT